jgi:hypothetical protein
VKDLAKEYVEKILMKVLKVARKTTGGDVVKDINDGYIYLDIMMQANDKNIVFEKRIRIDKADKMLNKFLSKIVMIAEEQYKDMTYYVADKESPETTSVLENSEVVNDKMNLFFGEVGQYLKTNNPAVLNTKLVTFEE